MTDRGRDGTPFRPLHLDSFFKEGNLLKEKYRIEIFGTLFLTAIFVFFAILTTQINEKIRTYPYFVCCLGIFLCALNLGRALVKQKKGEDIDAASPLTGEQLIAMLITLAASALYIFLASKIGYFIMTFIYVAGFSFYQNRTQKKWMYPVVALCMCIVIYLAFKVFLHVPLPQGMLF